MLLGFNLFIPQKSAANSAETVDPLRNVFIATLYGMAIGGVLGLAFSVAQADSKDWFKNFGTGAVLGGVVGATFGIAMEYKGVAEIKNNKVCFHTPTFRVIPDLTTNELMVHTDLVKLHF